MLQRTKQAVKSLIGIEDKPENVEFDQNYWNDLYASGRWAYLDQLDELSHYSVLVGYCQFFYPKGSILEVGCGEGLLQQRLEVLPYKRYIGVDISSVAIDKCKAQESSKTTFHQGDGASFIPNELVDIIIFNESLYCFNDCIAVLEHYQQFLNPEGVIVISMHVQAVASSHWEKIADYFEILDETHLKNSKGISWTCKAIFPKQAAQ